MTKPRRQRKTGSPTRPILDWFSEVSRLPLRGCSEGRKPFDHTARAILGRLSEAARLPLRGPALSLLFAVAALFAFVAASGAQQVYWTPSTGTLQQGKANRIALTFEGCSPDDALSVPQVPGLDLQNIGRGSSMNIINAAISQKVVLQYQASPTTDGQIVIPAFDAETDKGKVRVPQAVFEVVEASIGQSGAKPSDVFFSELAPLDDKLYVGEKFQIRYIIGINRNYRVNEISQPQWNPNGLVIGPLEDPQQQEFNYKGGRYVGLVYTVDAMATQPGALQVGSIRQTVSLVVGQRPGFIFNDPVIENYNVDSTTPKIEILPLPEGAPKSFDGAVGSFTLESKVVPETVQVGEPVTWTLSLQGNGNWPQNIGLAPRDVSANFHAIQPDVSKTISEKSPFEGSVSEDIVLIPTKPGDYPMGPFAFTFFDPKTESYETLTAPAKTVTVTPLAPAPGSAASPGALSAPSGGEPLRLDPDGQNLVTKPVELPAAPLLPGQSGRAPSGRVDLLPIVWAGAAPLLLWLALALARAVWLDPNKGRRQAYKQLQRIAAARGEGQSAESLKAAFKSWRKAARRFWEITAEEPSAGDVQAVVSHRADPEQGATWAALWSRTDQVLFGPESKIEPAWFERLREALRQAPRARRSFSTFLKSQAWTTNK